MDWAGLPFIEYGHICVTVVIILGISGILITGEEASQFVSAGMIEKQGLKHLSQIWVQHINLAFNWIV